MKQISIDKAVCSIKEMIESAIKHGGVEEKINLIRTQGPICMLHEAVKSQFIEKGVNPDKIRPSLGRHQGEQKLAGEFKSKAQDICILPNDKTTQEEIIKKVGALYGYKDKFGTEYTEHILSVNVRSQLSSIGKNFDTLYERTFAEAFNLHLRCPKMVLGEIYMIPVFEYDNESAKNNIVSFKEKQIENIRKHIEKYLYSFSAINNRRCVKREEYKYERVCLLIVDFRPEKPIIYHTDKQLKDAGLLSPDSTASINQMNFSSFADTLLSIYEKRFGNQKFK